MVVRNLDHVTIAVADAESAIEFFRLLGFAKQHVAIIDGSFRRCTRCRYISCVKRAITVPTTDDGSSRDTNTGA